ncbi:helix-turn-helix domain-containing protein [Deinococcus yunweiensis]|uniref:helix-turn-helix domain-containing protein n=1 Tax=Deinococcus yunweiensis TaxID=367282 RepID=UPI00398F7A77
MTSKTLDLDLLASLPERVSRLQQAVEPQLEPPDAILGTAAAAQLLGISPGELRTLAAGGEVPALRLGKGWRFSRRQLLEWFCSHARANAGNGATEHTGGLTTGRGRAV